ncbi:MAG: hypothetical protein Q9177_003551, partial [Variospora cf. flavescens]
MPNRYSHALVLSTYESKGLIDLPPHPSLHHLSLHPFFPSSTSDDATAAAATTTTTPPLNALPGLAASENSSTTSTTSSLDLHPASRRAGLPPQHSATSSLVTEIYAPPTGSPLPFEGRTTVIAAEEEDGHLIELPPPPGKKQLSQGGGPLSQIASIELPPPPSPPSSKQPPPPERPPSKVTSRFSSLHNFSAFLDPLPRAKRHRKRSHKDNPIRR